MKSRGAAAWAIRLLEHVIPDGEALAGDLAEEDERHHDVLWLWRQTIAAIALHLVSRRRFDEIRPLRLVDVPPADAIERARRADMTFRPINMSASPLSAAGGFGLVAMMLWLTQEAPDAWWLLAVAAAAGALVGLFLIIHRRAPCGARRRSILFGSAAVALALIAAPHVSAAQEFDVASIKPNAGDGSRGGALQPGRFSQTGVTLRQLIQMAYGNDQIAGGPDWLATDRFDVDARGDFPLSGFVPGPGGSPPLVYTMLRRLLEARFRLATHTEQQQRPVYALVAAGSTRQRGPRMQPSATDCDAVLAAAVQDGRPPAPPAPGSAPPCSVSRRPGVLHADSIDPQRLATVLASAADRPVVDRTGLTGRFNIDLEWTPELTAPASPDAAAAADSRVSLFTALQEQLGLKLESATAPVAVLVVDHAERPTPD